MGVGLMLMLWGARRQAQHEAFRKGELPGAAPKALTFLDTAVFSVGALHLAAVPRAESDLAY
jgi:hypothetical protein